MKERNYSFMEHMPDLFRLNDYSLSNLACRAGIAIDCHIKGIDNPLLRDYKPVTRLGKILYMSTEPVINYPNVSEFIPARDDVSLCVFLANLLGIYSGQKLQTIDEVVDGTRKIALDILKMREHPRKKQEQLKEFCLELSKSTGNYWHSRNPPGFKHYVA